MKSIAKLSVRGKLIFAALSGTVFVIVFFLLNHLYLNYQQKLDKQFETLRQLDHETALLQKEENAFLTELVNNNDILFLNIDNHLVNISKRYQRTIELLDSLRSYKMYTSDTAQLANIGHVENNLDELYHQYQDIILNYQKRGTVHHNLMKKWINTGDELETIIYEINELPLIIELNTLRKSEKNYIIHADQESLAMVRSSLDNIRSLINYNYPSYANRCNELCDDYLQLANQIGVINKRIGIGTNIGLRQQMATAANNLDDHLAELTEHQRQKTGQRKSRAFYILILVCGMLVILYFLLMLYLSRSIVRPLYKLNDYLERLTKGELPDKFNWDLKGELGKIINRLNHFIFSLKEKKDFALQLSNGNLEESLDLKSRKDILGKALISIQNNLESAHEEHQQHVQENRLRQYINEGINNISEVIQLHSNNLKQLSDEFIMRLVKYLGIEQGALFLMNTEKEQQVLELMGVFAYDRKKFMEKEVLSGQGLVGTCAREKKPIKPKNMPEDYIKITSGLGDSPPNHLFLMPVMNEDTVEGVIELASLKDFEEHQIELIKTIANSLGSALGSIRMNAQTSELLKKSQEQASEKAEQEEEMRQNMEELKATQEEATRREEATKNLMDAYHKTILLMEYDMEGKVDVVNDHYADYLGYARTAIIGKYHSTLFNTDPDSENEKKLWESLKNGEKQTLIESFSNKQGEVKWLYQQYTPVLNSEHKAYRVINIAFDITDQKNQEAKLEALDQEVKKEKSAFETIHYMIEQSIAKAEFNEEGKLLECNQNFEKLMGLESDDLKGKIYNEYLNKVEIEKFDAFWGHMIQSKSSISTVLRRNKPSGESIWISATFSPVFGKSKDKIEQIIMFGSDITDNIQRITS